MDRRLIHFVLIALSASLVAVSAAGFSAVSSAAAQNEPAQTDAINELITFFYKDPQPDRLIGFLEQLQSLPASANWEVYPPLVGFFAYMFRANPDDIERLLPEEFNPKSAAAIAAALHLSGHDAIAAKIQPKLDQAGSDEKLKSELMDLPAELERLDIKSPTHLDILWGAAFASGEERFVLMIIKFFARTANRSEQVALDVMKTAAALSGGPQDIYEELRGRHGDILTRELIFAATALWALRSNARRHAFVKDALLKFRNDHSGTLAARIIAAFKLGAK